MRPPIMWITVGFGAGLWVGLSPFGVGGALFAVALVAMGVLVSCRRAPVGSAVGIMGIAGVLWGGAALAERGATCGGSWGEEGRGKGEGYTHAAIVRLLDPVPDSGGVVE